MVSYACFSLILLIFGIPQAAAFKPDRLTAGNDFSHDLITEYGAKRFLYKLLYDELFTDHGSSRLSNTDIDELTAKGILSRFYTDQAATARTTRFNAVLETITEENMLMSIRPGESLTASLHFYSEAITAGNDVLRRTKQSVTEAISKSDWKIARLQIGRYLHTLQSFYSNTNWVTLFPLQDDGGIISSGLGSSSEIPGYTSPDVQPIQNCPSHIGTCTDCPTTCETPYSSFLRLFSYLTSGYKFGAMDDSGKTITRPSTNLGFSKCIHGGSSDGYSTRVTTAGINKESSNPVESPPPQNELHEKAAYRAIKATERFLLDLLNENGINATLDLFDLRVQTSLAIVMDDTGSMREEIDAAKAEAKRLVDEYSAGGSIQLILVAFDDPEVRVAANTNDPDLFKAELDKLVAHGGGDTPEYCLTGIRRALEIALPNSHLFVFTDAPAKDTWEEETVEALSVAKNIRITFLVTDVSPSRRRKKRVTPITFYADLAALSGGSIYYASSSNIGTAVDVITSTLASDSSVPLYKSSQPSAGSTSHQFPVDPSVSHIRLELSSLSTVEIDSVSDSSGILESTAEIDLVNIKANNFSNPSPGTWTVNISCNAACEFAVEASSGIQFTHTLLEVVSIDGEVAYAPLESKPIAGSISAVLVNLDQGSWNTTQLQYVLFLSTTGHELNRCPVTKLRSSSYACYNATTPEAEFVVGILGTDLSTGHAIQRLDSDMIIPVNLKVTAPSTFHQLSANSSINLNLTLTSPGVNETFAVSWNQPDSILIETGTSSVKLLDGLAVLPVQIQAPSNASVGTSIAVRFEFVSTSDADLNNFIVLNIVLVNSSDEMVISDTTTPSCEIFDNTIESSCSPEPGNCLVTKWSAKATLTDSDSGLAVIEVGPTSTGYVTVSGINITAGTNSTTAQVDGNCCQTYLAFSVYDMAGNAQTCVIGNVSSLLADEPIEVPEDLYTCKVGSTNDVYADRTTEQICTHCVGYYYQQNSIVHVQRGCSGAVVPLGRSGFLSPLDCTMDPVQSRCVTRDYAKECYLCCTGSDCNKDFTSTAITAVENHGVRLQASSILWMLLLWPLASPLAYACSL